MTSRYKLHTLLAESEIKLRFFDTNATSKIDPKELKQQFNYLDFNKNPTFYQLIADLDTPDKNTINNKLNDKESKEGIRRIFDFFIDVPNSDFITLNSLKKISKELGENMSGEKLKIMLERASKNGVELTFYTK